MIEHVRTVYCEVSFNRFSKPNTAAVHVLNEFHEGLSRECEQAAAEATEEMRADLEDLKRKTLQIIEPLADGFKRVCGPQMYHNADAEYADWHDSNEAVPLLTFKTFRLAWELREALHNG